MPLLDEKGLKQDNWLTPDTSENADLSNVIIPWEQAETLLQTSNQKIAISIKNNLSIEKLIPFLSSLSLISIEFPIFSDGRGFSQAKALRNSGFKGIIRAKGPLIPDQFAFALSSGFDEVDIPDETLKRQPEAQWVKALTSISHGYQTQFNGKATIFDMRRANRHTKSQ